MISRRGLIGAILGVMAIPTCIRARTPKKNQKVFDILHAQLCRVLAGKTEEAVNNLRGCDRAHDGNPVFDDSSLAPFGRRGVYCFISQDKWAINKRTVESLNAACLKLDSDSVYAIARDAFIEIGAAADTDEPLTDEEWAEVMEMFRTRYSVA